MARNIHLTTQQYRSVAPLGLENPDALSADSVVVDEQTYWTGKDNCFVIVNGDPFPRWYRLVVTNLKRGEEYLLFTNQTRLDEDCLIEIDTGDEYEVCLVLGGERQQEPLAPRHFEIYVEEYATPQENGKFKVISTERLQWIPKPNEKTITLTTQEKELRVRPWPWKQRVRFHAALINRSFLPITAEVRALPDEASQEAGLDELREPLRQAIPPLKEQPVVCEITLEKKLTAPVQLSVSADTLVPALQTQLTTTPQTVDIVPVPWLKIWYDWVVVGVAAFLAFWLLFGMPPVVQPTTRLVLKLQDLPRDARPDDLDVKLTPVSRDGRPGGMEFRKGRVLPGAQSGTFLYEFDWGPVWKGFRWTWREEDLKLSIEPKATHANLYLGYDFNAVPIKAHSGEEVTISRRYGISAESLQAELSHKSGISLLVKPDAATLPQDDPITLNILVNGEAMPPLGYVAGDPISVPESMVSKHKTLEIRVTATNQAGTLEAHSVIHPLPQSAPIAVTLPSFQRVVTKVPGTSGPPQTGGGPGTGGIPAAGGTPKTGGTAGSGGVPATGGTPGTGGAPGSAGAPKTGGTPGSGGIPAGGGTPGTGANPSIPAKVDPDPIVAKWCTYLKADGWAAQISAEKLTPNALKLQVSLPPPDANNNYNYNFTVTADQDCVCQIYDIRTGKGVFANPIYAAWNETHNDYDLRPSNPLDGRPIPLKANVPWTWDDRMTGGNLKIVVLAYRPPKLDMKFEEDLVSFLKHSDGKGFAITGLEYTK